MASISQAWYKPTLDSLDPEARTLFETYSKIPSDKVIPHIEAVRNEAWKLFPYPCIGRFHFTHLSLSHHPSYPEYLSRIQSGAAFLDIGCCFGQDIRKLVLDGAPSDNLHGSDVIPGFLDLGYQLFLDRDSLKATFIPADALAPDSALDALRGSIELVHAASFFHLWPLDTQKVAARRVLSLLSPAPGNMIVGRQGGDLKGREIMHGSGKEGEPMKRLYWHNEQTWRTMWEDVAAEAGRKVDVQSELVWDEQVFNRPKEGEDDGRQHGDDTRKMVFVIRTL